MSARPSPTEIEALLAATEKGDEAASDALVATLVQELRGMARAQLRRLPPGQTLQPTALVNEAYLRLLGKEVQSWRGREDFLFLAARAMHDVLVESARRKASLKGGAEWRRTDDPKLEVATESSPAELLALDELLTKLAKEDPRKAELVRLRFFVGLSEEDTALALGVSTRTVSRQWRFVKAWLYDELREGREDA